MKLAAIALTSAVAMSGALVAAPSGAADPSAPDQTAFGTYSFNAEDGETATWNLRPCPGDPPGCVRVAEFGNSRRAPWSADAHYTVGSWFMFVGQPDAIQCDDGTTAPGQNTYSWDNVTLVGNASVLTNGTCGPEKKNQSIPFRLSKIGGPPVQAPEAPAGDDPSPPPTAPASDAPAPAPELTPVPVPVPQAPPAAPLPAESPAGT